jgi:hypothetical protein
LEHGSPAINCGIDVGLPFISELPDLGAYESNDMITTSVQNMKQHKPAIPYLVQNYPNPFNPRTMINYQLSVMWN